MIDFLLHTFDTAGDADAIAWRGKLFSYRWLSQRVNENLSWLAENEIAPGSVVSLEADFSPNATATLLALIQHSCTVVPLTEAAHPHREEFLRVAEVQAIIRVNADDAAQIHRLACSPTHPTLLRLRELRHPGLVLFSSGSTGKSKAAVHDLAPLLEKFKVRRKTLRTIAFLLFDHIGGINTLLHTLSNAGCLITTIDRRAGSICALIEEHRADVLPTTPSFLNLLLISKAYEPYDLSSLRLVTYGTEMMPEPVLRAFHERFPAVQLLQTYGMSETGILRTRSKSSDSLWVTLGGDGFQTRVVDGFLEVNARCAMLGYLNAPSPFTADGWLRTGDAVLVDGEYVRFLGRKSELINVGGEKVYPAEVEDILLAMPEVQDVSVTGDANPILGQVVKATVKLVRPEPLPQFRARMRAWCNGRLAAFKVPQKVVFTDQEMHGARFKKLRRG